MLKLATMVKEDINLIYARANIYLAKGCLDLAESLYFKLLNLQEKSGHLDPEMQADIHHNLGMIAEKRHNLDLAIQYYRKAVDINSNRSMTWLFLAKLYLNRYDRLGNQADYTRGFHAIQQAENNNSRFPIIRLLKEKYAAC